MQLAIAQFKPAKAAPHLTLDRIEGVFRRLARLDAPPDLVVFPEAALTGYFLEGGVREHSIRAPALAEALAERYARADGAGRPLDVTIGFYEEHEHRLYNSALYVTLGDGEPRIAHVHRKVFLPTYGVFQEERFVESGSEVRAFDTRWGRAAILICEDVFHSISATLAALDGAQLLLVPSASPARGAVPGPGVPGNVERWSRLAAAAAEEHGVFVAVSQLVGFEGGKGFAGSSVVYGPRGDLVLRGPLWDEALLEAALDLDEITAARVEQPLLADLERTLPRLLQSRGAGRAAAGAAERGAAEAGAGAEAVSPPGADGGAGAPGAPRIAGPPRPGDTGRLAVDEPLVREWLVRFLREEIRGHRGFDRAVVGLSGGVDSALTAALCAEALGPASVTAFLMPYRTSSPKSCEHAHLVAETLGIEAVEIEITAAVDAYVERFEPEADDRRRGNVMARERMIVLFDQAAKLGALPIGTGNKSERLLGYFTWHADDSPPINPLGDLYKTQVWALARHVGVPEAIVEKPASADLIRGQTDEGDLGISYPEADLILDLLLGGTPPARLAECGFDPGKIEIVRDRLEGTHWKRHLPTVAMLSATTIGEWYLRPVDY